MDACEEAVQLGMTQEQYDKYLIQKKEIEEEYGAAEEEDKDEEKDELQPGPGENFKEFKAAKDEEVKEHKVKFDIQDGDKDPEMQDLKAKMLAMMAA